MTQEEIIQAIIDDKTMPFIQPEQLAGIVDFVIKNYKPSLPSNLDEAAQRIAYDVCKQLPNGEEKDGIVYYAILAAIAGAEWMEGQGYTKEETVYFERLCDENRIMVDLGWGEPERGGFNPGDKVVVQIRKK